MEHEKRVSRRWRTATLLAVGILIGVAVAASPATGHFGSIKHLWNKHIKPRADARYINNAETAANADMLDGLDSAEFQTVGRSGAGDCDPSSATFVTCASVTFSFPRNGRAFIVATTDWESFGAASSGQCRIEVDGNVQPGTVVRPGETTDTTDNDAANGAASTVVTDVLSAASHTFALTCNQLTGNFDPDDAKVSALMIGAT
jgi:hypothetical protein